MRQRPLMNSTMTEIPATKNVNSCESNIMSIQVQIDMIGYKAYIVPDGFIRQQLTSLTIFRV